MTASTGRESVWIEGGRRRLAARGLAIRLWLAAQVGMVGLMPAGTLLAQVNAPQKAAAEALFVEGRELLYNHEYEAACRRFEESQAVDPGVGTLLYLGDCYERLGRVASAWAMYREAFSAARAAGQADRSRVAQEHASKLEPKLSKLSVLVAPENRVAGFELTINGKPVADVLFGVPVPFDPGRYELVARAPGHGDWSTQVEVKANGQQTTAQVPALQSLSPAAQAAGQGGAAPSGLAARELPAGGVDPYESDRGQPLGRQAKIGLVVAGGGVVAVGTGLVFGTVASNKDDKAKAGCPSGCVSQEAAYLNESARNWATAANVSYVIGALALTTGAILYFTDGSDDAQARPARLTITPELGRERNVLTVGGAF
jgi:tetratricopeptide (TPR) repeat protein